MNFFITVFLQLSGLCDFQNHIQEEIKSSVLVKLVEMVLNLTSKYSGWKTKGLMRYWGKIYHPTVVEKEGVAAEGLQRLVEAHQNVMED